MSAAGNRANVPGGSTTDQLKPVSSPFTTMLRHRNTRLNGVIAVCLVGAAYLVAAGLLYGRLQPLDRTHLPTCSCGDIVNQVWFLSFSLRMLRHGQLSLWTNLLNYPVGINTADNASFPLLGLLVSPVTSWSGPVASFALLVRLSFFISAFSCFFVLKRLVRSRTAAAFGGVFYGFSPYMAHQGADHMFLVFAPFPPLLFYVLYRLVQTKAPENAFTSGLLLGGLIAAQYLISSEIAVSFVLISGLMMAWFAGRALYRRQPVGGTPRVAVTVLAGVALVAGPLLAYPAWNAIAGRAHVGGPTQLVSAPGIDILSAIFPVGRLVLAGFWREWRIPPVPMLGDTGFIGIPLLVVLVYIAVRCRGQALVKGAVALGVVSWVLALGPRLVVHGGETKIPLPFALLTRVPVLQDIVPSRLTLYIDLAAAVLLCVGLDALLANLASGLRWVPGIAVAALLASAALVAPVTRYPVAGLNGAEVFSEAAVARQIPSGGVVLAYPYPVFPEDQAMLWQALSNMRFSLLGGYVVRPLQDGDGTKVPPLLSPPAVPSLLLEDWPELQVTGTQPASLDRARSDLRAFVARYHVSTVVVERAGRRPGQVIALVSSVYGPPVSEGNLDFWFNIRPSSCPGHRGHYYWFGHLAGRATYAEPGRCRIPSRLADSRNVRRVA